MGYYVSGEGSLTIKNKNLPAAYEALMALQDAPDEGKHGGSFSATETRRWYSWMPEDLRTIPTVQDVFRELGFEVEVDGDTGDVLIGRYDSKMGQEEVFFIAAAPFIESGEYEWQGEDGVFWKWSFHEGKMFHLDGTRSYGHASIVSA
jgi:hypothetical protein